MSFQRQLWHLAQSLGRWTKQSFVIWPVVVVGAIVSLATFVHIDHQIESRQSAEFEWLTLERDRAIRNLVNRALEAVDTTRAFFLVAEPTQPRGFRLFADSLLSRIPGLQALAWAPWVPGEQRADFEQHARASYPDFQLQEESPTGERVISPPRQNHYPVFYAALAANVGPILGLDLASMPQALGAIERARDRGTLTSTQRLRLPPAGDGERYGFLAFLPLYRADVKTELPDAQRGRLLGFVIGMVDIPKLVDGAIAQLEPRGVELLIEDETAPAGERFLDFYSSRLTREAAVPQVPGVSLRETSEKHIRQSFPVADRTWSVTSTRVPGYRSGEAFAEGPWFILIGGLLLTAILGFYLIAIRRAMLDRLRMETELREREELFSQMTETVNEVFWATSVDRSRFLYLSRGFERIWNLPRNAVYTRPGTLLDNIYPEDRPKYEAAMQQLQQQHEPVEALYRVMRHSNGLRWVRDSAFPVRDAWGQVYRIVGFAEDVTEKVLVELALRESEQKLRTAFNQSPDVLMMVDPKGRILMLNRSLPQLTADKAPGQDSAVLFPPDLQSWYRHTFQEALQSGEIDHLQYSLADGSWWEARLVPILQEEEVTAIMVIAADVTENRKLQLQAMHNARLATLGVMAAGVAHEINNPNNAIKLNATLLGRAWQEVTPILREYAKEYGDFSVVGLAVDEACTTLAKLAADVGANSDRINRIVSNLKHLSKQDKGELDGRVSVINVLGATTMILHGEIRKRTDHFTMTLGEDLPSVKGNCRQLEQVFINLLLNALQSLPDRSRGVELSAQTSQDGARILVSIRDEGMGISPEHLERLKEPFFTTRADSDGLGLGLSISNDIILRHRGSIEFTSEPGKGTTVTVVLPIAAPPGEEI